VTYYEEKEIYFPPSLHIPESKLVNANLYPTLPQKSFDKLEYALQTINLIVVGE